MACRSIPAGLLRDIRARTIALREYFSLTHELGHIVLHAKVSESRV